MTSNSQCDVHDHECACGPTVAAQSLEELEFERGIWGAAYEGDDSRVYSLLKGFNFDRVDKVDAAGYTALHYAARNGHLDVCKRLLNHGANINAITRSGKASALHRAASAGHKDIVKLLLSKKADFTMRDADGKTALHRAAENNHTEICDILIDHFPPLKDVPDNKGNKAKLDY